MLAKLVRDLCGSSCGSVSDAQVELLSARCDELRLSRFYALTAQMEVLRLSPGSVRADVCVLTDPDQQARSPLTPLDQEVMIMRS